jgi:hypothetical protein
VKRIPALLSILFVLGTPAWAHVVLTDGTIGVTMHIDPDDAPVVGKLSRFNFWFKDTTGHLDPARCKGTFTVALNDWMVTSQPLFALKDSGLVSVHEVTFARPGVYTVRVNGYPTGTVTFQPFLLQFSVRVEAGDAGMASGTSESRNWFLDHALVLIGGLLVAGLILWLGLRPRERKKSS